MSSINDVLKEKFGVNGSNIAETLSKITPGEGGGSGGSGWLVVNVIVNDENQVPVRLDKTAGEIINAWPLVVFSEIADYGDNGRCADIYTAIEYVYTPSDILEIGHVYAFYPYPSKDTYFACDSLSEYPSYLDSEHDDK